MESLSSQRTKLDFGDYFHNRRWIKKPSKPTVVLHRSLFAHGAGGGGGGGGRGEHSSDPRTPSESGNEPLVPKAS